MPQSEDAAAYSACCIGSSCLCKQCKCLRRLGSAASAVVNVPVALGVNLQVANPSSACSTSFQCVFALSANIPATSFPYAVAQEAGVPVAAGTKMIGCMYGPGHDELLQLDMRNTAALGVQTSATIQVG
jgi:hypothetical protein